MISDAALRRVLSASTVALVGDLVRALLWGLAVVVWLAFLQVYLRMIRLTLADPSGSDFTIFYYTARMVADGLPMYGESPARYGVKWAGEHLGNLNPPHFQLLFQPLASLPYVANGNASAAFRYTDGRLSGPSTYIRPRASMTKRRPSGASRTALMRADPAGFTSSDSGRSARVSGRRTSSRISTARPRVWMGAGSGFLVICACSAADSAASSDMAAMHACRMRSP